MKMLFKTLLLVCPLVLMSGCATLNEDECYTADWYEIGFNDGVKGQPHSYLEKHRKACSKHGVRANFDEWQAGHEEGLKRYCTPQKGYEEGLNNRTYHGVCEGRSADKFSQAYEQGQQLYQQRSLVSDLQRDFEQTSDDIVALEDEWNVIRRELLNDNLSATQRAELINQLERNKEQSETLRIRRDRLDDDLHRAQYDLDMMERGDFRY
jgi:hypothetical protein